MTSGAAFDAPFSVGVDEPIAAMPGLNNLTLAQQVYDHLRRDILANTYLPGEALPEEAVAARLKVSRAPVREAIRRLAAEGLATLIPRQGAVVRSLSPRDFLNAYQVREALETLAVRLAAPRLDASDLDALDRLHDTMSRHAGRNQVDAFFEANAAFHAVFVDRSGNDKLQEVYYPLVAQMRRYYLPSLYLRGGMERSIGEHGDILRALREQDVEEAVRLVGEHIRVPQRMLESDSQVELVPGPRGGPTASIALGEP